MKPVVASEDIFLKAAIEYSRRIGAEPFIHENFICATYTYRNQLADLAERINSLKTVGAI